MLAFVLVLFQGDPATLVEKLASDSVAERESAERGLKELGQASVPHLERAARSSDGEVAARARRLLQLIAIRVQLTAGLLEAMPGVDERLLKGGDPAWADVLLEAVSWYDSKRVHPSLRRDDLLPLVERAVRFARDPVGRRETCVLARQWALGPAAPALVDRLSDDISDVRSNASEALVALGAVTQVPRILPLLRHDRADVRISAAECLAGLGPPEAGPAIAALLEDREEYVRFNALLALRFLGTPEIAPAVRPFLDHSRHTFRQLAVEFAAAVGDRESIPKIRRMLAVDEGVEEEAMAALAAMGVQEAVPEIRTRLQARSSSRRGVAIRSLDRLDAIDAATLRPFLRDLDTSVTRPAAVALALRGEGSGALQLLQSPLHREMLNAIRRPEEWRRLRSLPLKGTLQGTLRELYERLAREAGLRLELPGDWEPSPLWTRRRIANPGDRLTVADALTRISGHYHPVLEPGRLRLLPPDTAIAFWKNWIEER